MCVGGGEGEEIQHNNFVMKYLNTRRSTTTVSDINPQKVGTRREGVDRKLLLDLPLAVVASVDGNGEEEKRDSWLIPLKHSSSLTIPRWPIKRQNSFSPFLFRFSFG